MHAHEANPSSAIRKFLIPSVASGVADGGWWRCENVTRKSAKTIDPPQGFLKKIP
jgi:hypothetical protein